MAQAFPERFRAGLFSHLNEFRRVLATEQGDWTVKGFIDVYRNIYAVSLDTKVVSKIFELMLFPVLSRFAAEHEYGMVLSEHQNHYPDISFILPDGTKIALDLKSTYRTGPDSVAGLTLGAFTGYFRLRQSSKNITFPYEQYAKHFVLGLVYSRNDDAVDERRVYPITELQNIVSVIKDFEFVLQEKWQIASDQPGSGNTKNIGSAHSLKALTEGGGGFAKHGEDVFDDYWMNYLTADMARAIDSRVPYRNLTEYFEWRDQNRRRKRNK